MSTTTQITQTSTGLVGLGHRTVVNGDVAALALFCALGLLASFYIMTHFPVEGFLAAWL
jgi:hypothetical protein